MNPSERIKEIVREDFKILYGRPFEDGESIPENMIIRSIIRYLDEDYAKRN